MKNYGFVTFHQNRLKVRFVLKQTHSAKLHNLVFHLNRKIITLHEKSTYTYYHKQISTAEVLYFSCDNQYNGGESGKFSARLLARELLENRTKCLSVTLAPSPCILLGWLHSLRCIRDVSFTTGMEINLPRSFF